MQELLGQFTILPAEILGAPSASKRMLRPWVAPLVIVWVLAVSVMMGALIAYARTPARAGEPPVKWPAQTALRLDAHRPTLLVFLHPKCPCSRATLGELDALLARSGGRVTPSVVFVRPDGASADWAKTDLWRQASAIPGVDVRVDESGVEARRFAAEISGLTLLYGPDGRLMFHGGITKARGHSGDNDGRSALVALLEGTDSDAVRTPVFGCPLLEIPEESKRRLE